MSAGYDKPLPRLEGAERQFWEGLREHEVRVQRCTRCGTYRFPASRFCPACHGDGYAWTTVDPVGRIESYCVFHKPYFPGFADDVPYAVVQVRLDCGVQFFSNMVDVARQDIRTGMRVTAAFDPVTPEATLLKFRPIEETA